MGGLLKSVSCSLIRWRFRYLKIGDVVHDAGRDGVVINGRVAVGLALAPAVIDHEPTRLVEFANRPTDRVAAAKARGGKLGIGRPCVAFFCVDEADDFQGHADR